MLLDVIPNSCTPLGIKKGFVLAVKSVAVAIKTKLIFFTSTLLIENSSFGLLRFVFLKT